MRQDPVRRDLAAAAREVARQAHDGPAQAFFGISATAEMLLKDGEMSEDVRSAVERIARLARAGEADVRAAIAVLRALAADLDDETPG